MSKHRTLLGTILAHVMLFPTNVSLCTPSVRRWVPALIASLLLLPSVALAHDVVHISGSHSARWDGTQETLTAEGDVLVTVDDITIRGERLVWYAQRQELYMDGNVVFSQDGQEFMGDALVFRADTAQGEFTAVRMEVTSERAKGPIFVFGEQVAIDGNTYRLRTGEITTCVGDSPHYHVAVREMEIHPGDRLVIRGVTYYEGRVPLFYWPFLVIPLRDVEHGTLALPRIGYGATEGWYVKNTLNYYLNHRSYGSIYLDYYTRLGPGYGVRHRYHVGGDGSVYVYHIPRESHQVLRTRWEHDVETEQVQLSAYTEYEATTIDGKEEHYRSSWLDLNVSGEAYRFEGKVSHDDEDITRPKTSWDIQGKYEQDFTDKLRLTLSGRFTQQEEASSKRRMVNRLGSLAYRERAHTLTLTVQERYNPDVMDTEARPNWSSVNRVPELTWQWRNLVSRRGFVPGRVELGLARIREFPADIERWRISSKVDLASHTWRPTGSTTLTYRGNIQGYLYSENDAQGAMENRLNLYHRFTPRLTLSGTYTKRDTVGDSPFRFDRLTESHLVSGQVTYNRAPVNVSLRTGYNLLTEKYQDAVASVRLNGERWTSTLHTNYDLNARQPGNFVGVVGYKPDEQTALQLGVRYGIADKRWERLDGKLTFRVSDSWIVGYDAIYHPDKAEFRQGQISLTRDDDCRAITFRYDQVKQEFWLEYTIKAFPEVPLRFGPDGMESLFDILDVQDLLGVEEEAR